MTKEYDEDFENSTRCWIYDNLTDHCLITGKCRGSAHRDCNINVKLSHIISIVPHSLSYYTIRI